MRERYHERVAAVAHHAVVLVCDGGFGEVFLVGVAHTEAELLGAVARKQTAEAMRKKNVYLPLEDDALITLDRLWEQMVEKERCEALAQALAALPEEDREIFYRFYDLSQTTAQIADELHMNASTVRSRLLRGREALRKTLTKGGLFCEDDVG